MKQFLILVIGGKFFNLDEKISQVIFKIRQVFRQVKTSRDKRQGLARAEVRKGRGNELLDMGLEEFQGRGWIG